MENNQPLEEKIVEAEASVHIEQKSNKVNRANRTVVQFVVALIASGTLVGMWQALVSTASLDPVLVAVITPFLIWLVSYAQNAAEDAGFKVPGLTSAKFDEVSMVINEKSITPEPDTQINK